MESPEEKSKRQISKLKQLNYSMEVDEDKVEATVRTPGLSYSDYDGISHQPKPYQLMKLFESARFYAHHWPLDDTGRTFRDYAQMTSDRFTFLVTSRFDIFGALYDLTTPKTPIDIKILGGYIGNASVNTLSTAYTKDGVRLVSNINQVVSVDKESRRPSLIPDWWKNKYAKSAENHSSLKVSKLEKPEDTEPFHIRVLRSDLDGYRHVNWTSYVRFSMDSIHHFVKNDKLTDCETIDFTKLKSMELLYSGECFDDDILDVFAWKQVGVENKVSVQIFKMSNLIFQGCYEYFSKEK